MKKGAGKRKGGAFERLSGKLLSLWITKRKDRTQLIRSEQSGGWKGGGVRHAGDLAANGPLGELFRSYFIVECKHRNTDLLWRLFTGGADPSLQFWWAKLEAEAKEKKREPLLVFRENARPVMVAVADDLASFIEEQVGPPSLYCNHIAGRSFTLFTFTAFTSIPASAYYDFLKENR